MQPPRAIAPWRVGLAGLPFALVLGFGITALPFLLAKAGIGVERIAGVSAVAASPTFWAFLLTPLVDVGLTRRRYAFVLAIVAAASLAAALASFSPDRLPLFTALMLVAQLAAVLQNNAVLGWISQFAADAHLGKVSAWLNAVNLGAGAGGSMLAMWAAEHLPLSMIGLLGAVVIAGSTLALLHLPHPAPPAPGRRAGEIARATFRNIAQTSRQPRVLGGFLLFLAPASCAAAINLFAALGADFHADAAQVIWVTGAGAAIAGTLGSLLGGHAADRIDRGVLYLGGGLLTGLCALASAAAPHAPAVFVACVLGYNLLAGVCYAGCSALCLQLAGTNNPTAASQIGLFFAASNVPIVYMTWFDGLGYRAYGVRGLLLVDGLASLVAAVALLLFWRGRARSRLRERPTG